jgi:hypothetical protein
MLADSAARQKRDDVTAMMLHELHMMGLVTPQRSITDR